MRKIVAFFISIGASLFLLAQKVMAAAVNTATGGIQDMYGVPNDAQTLYGPPIYGSPDMQLAYGPSVYEVSRSLLGLIIWLVLVPIVFIVGYKIFISKRRKNKKKFNVQKDSQNRRA